MTGLTRYSRIGRLFAKLQIRVCSLVTTIIGILKIRCFCISSNWLRFRNLRAFGVHILEDIEVRILIELVDAPALLVLQFGEPG